MSAILACNFDKSLGNRAPLSSLSLTGQILAAIVRPPLDRGMHDATPYVSSVCTEEGTVLGRRVLARRQRP